MYTNTSMCVFNKCTNEDKETTFKRHIIENVFWDDSKGVNLNMGYENADNVNVYIPKNKNDMGGYTKPKSYKGNSSEWTLQNGDFIVKGVVSDNTVSKIADLTSKYDDVFTITLVDDKDFGSHNMRHFEIRGK